MDAYLGIDTSCYTTSVALLSEAGELLAAERSLLKVKPGGRGLAQSEMLYQHTRNLPVLLERALTAGAGNIAAIGVSSRPRPVESSYMPAFLAGLGVARSLGAALAVPVLALSHQENHLEAGLWSAGGSFSGPFLVFHVSGGTTELVRAERSAASWRLDCLGGSRDLHAGQMIDRTGVALGLPFPAGPALEALAAKAEPLALPVSVQGTWCSFSGPLSAAERLFAAGGVCPAALAGGVIAVVAQSLIRMAQAAVATTGLRQMLLVGGVMANRQIRAALAAAANSSGWLLHFADPACSSDHAIGCAAAVRRWRAEGGGDGLSSE